MRTNVKKRIQFFAVAIIVYTIGFNFIPETLAQTGQWQDLMPVIIASLGYFVFLPILYWILIIKGNQQKPWKLLLILSLSGAMARFSYPESFAAYFEFLMWLKYPIIAVVVIFEFYLMYTIIKGIWGARKLSGDPRLHTLKTYADDEKKLTAGLPFAWEPASWYYAIPRFSRNHLPTMPALNLAAASRWNYLLSMLALFTVGFSAYFALVGWSEIAALFTMCFILYSSVMLAARHRSARNYSLYISKGDLVINGSFWGLTAIPLANIDQIALVDVSELPAKKDSTEKERVAKNTNGATEKTKSDQVNDEHANSENLEPLVFGRKKIDKSVKITLSENSIYHGVLGQFPEKFTECYLNSVQARALYEQLLSAKGDSDNLPLSETTTAA